MKQKHIGYAIQILRRRPGRRINQQAIAAACGVAESTVSKWETGRLPVPTDQLPIICSTLGVTEAELRKVTV